MIETALTRRFGLRHPIVLAPMGGVSGGCLAAAVARAGGLGLVGGGYGDADWVRREVELAVQGTRDGGSAGAGTGGTTGAWGVGFIAWSTSAAVLEMALQYQPAAVMLSFGDPGPHATLVKAAGAALICQVQGIDEARLAVAAGADFIVAQGTEAGGHGAGRATLPLVPAIIDAVAPIPVIAAGGIADGRGLAAALMLGAEGALIGTRFYAADEAIGHDAVKRRIVQAEGGQTERTVVFDRVRGYDWPRPYTGRALRNAFMARWAGRENDPALVGEAERSAFWRAVAEGDADTAMVWAGEGVDLIDAVEPAARLVHRIGAEAESRLRAGAERLRR